MQIKKSERLMIIRYSDFLIKGCIKLHQEVLRDNGFVWFGKVGKQKPSKKFRDNLMQEDVPKIILHSSTKDYLCEIDDISEETPDGGYPEYYKEVLFDNNNYPSVYFRIRSFTSFDHKYLKNFVVNSSRNDLSSALHGSMNSLFFIECINSFSIEEE